MSSDHDYWGNDSSDFLENLANIPLEDLDADLHVGVKRKRSPDDEGEPENDPDIDFNPSLITSKQKPLPEPNAKNEDYVYGAANFGGFGEYMFRKRAKLQIQNRQLDGVEADQGSQIFKGVAVYVNGFTDPPFQDIREMIMAHGGVFHAYLDRKGMVTHVIASQLTPAKILEYQRGKMKVVKPEWVVKSVELGVLQRWQDYALKPGTAAIAALGRGTDFSGAVTSHAADVDQASSIKARIPQMTLLDGFATQKAIKSSATQSPAVKPTPRPQVKAVAAPSKVITPSKPATVTEATKTTPTKPRNIENAAAGPSTPKRSPFQVAATTSPTPKRKLPDPDVPEVETTPDKPSYALYDSNPIAAKLMESTQWRQQNTSANPAAFTESYFQNSRLHHLSTWKSALRKLVAEARERAEKGLDGSPNSSDVPMDNVSMEGIKLQMPSRKGKEKAADTNVERTIMHCDFDSFFVAAGLVDRPQLRGKPVVVCHSGGGKASTSEIASASYEAREFGIKNGMSLGQARQLCPAVQTIPYEFERYQAFSLQFYTILMGFADDLQAVSVDEALLDVSQRVGSTKAEAGDAAGERDFAKELAEQIRDKVRERTGCEISVGISHNIMLARMATRKAKPAGSFHLLPEDVAALLAPLPFNAVHGVGRSIRDKITEKYNIETLGELLEKPKESLQKLLGKGTGEKMWKAARGLDDTRLESDTPRKSVSAEVNYGIRFENEEQAELFIHTLAIEVSKRLKAIGRKGKLLTLKIMVRSADAPQEAAKFLGHGQVDCHNKSSSVADARGAATDDPEVIGKESWKLLKSMNFDPKELRGIGMQIQKLDDESGQSSELLAGQSRLSFSKAPKGKQVVDEDVEMMEVEKARPAFELPSASQIDQEVLDSLPDDIKAEILANVNKAGSSKPAARSNTAPASRGAQEIDLTSDDDEAPSHVRSQSVPTAGSQPKNRAPMVPSPQTKAASMSPTKAAAAQEKSRMDVRHITKQLAPKRKVPFISPTKPSLFNREKSVPKSGVTDEELKLLGVDPAFFRELPEDIRREQLTILRQSKPAKTWAALRPVNHVRTSRSPSVGVGQKPKVAAIPVAAYTELPQIKKLSTAAEIQEMIKEWVKYRKTEGPVAAEVERIVNFLVKCAASDVGLENASSILRYWRVLLRQRWKSEEEAGDVIDVDGCATGRAWWDAFRRAKRKVDEVVKKRLGSSLGLGR